MCRSACDPPGIFNTILGKLTYWGACGKITECSFSWRGGFSEEEERMVIRLRNGNEVGRRKWRDAVGESREEGKEWESRHEKEKSGVCVCVCVHSHARQHSDECGISADSHHHYSSAKHGPRALESNPLHLILGFSPLRHNAMWARLLQICPVSHSIAAQKNFPTREKTRRRRRSAEARESDAGERRFTKPGGSFHSFQFCFTTPKRQRAAE